MRARLSATRAVSPIAVLLLAAALAVCGCAYGKFGHELDTINRHVIINETTREEIVSRFGEPTEDRVIGDEEIMIYRFAKGTFFLLAGVHEEKELVIRLRNQKAVHVARYDNGRAIAILTGIGAGLR